jgi:hypothetical protein
MTFYESNPEVGPTGAEAGEFVDDGPLSSDDDAGDDAGDDATRRPTGSPPLADANDDAHEEDEEPGPHA